MSDFYVGLDVGTQSTKGIVLDAGAEGARAIVARAAESYGLIEGLPAGAAEQHPETWRQAVKLVLERLLAKVNPGQVRGVGVSGQQHGLVTLDAEDRVIRPAKLWCDTTTAAEAAEITAQGRYAVSAGFTSPKMLWMKRHEPERWARVRSVLLPHDYVNFLLSGAKFTEAGDASGNGAFDPARRDYDRSTLDFIDRRAFELMPKLVAADRPAARVSARAAREFGLREGTLVAPGGGDNMMSAIGSGATRSGVTVVSLGTSGTAFAYVPGPVIDPEGLIAPFCDSTGGWLPLMCTMNVTGVTEAVRALFGNPDHEELTREAEAVAPRAGGLVFLPYLQGERVPNLPHATGALCGLRAPLLTRGHLFRAAIEGTTLAMVSGIRRMEKLGLAVSTVHLVGGGSKNRLWRQVFADALQAPVRLLVEPESACLGAAIQAYWVVEREAGSVMSADEAAARFVEFAPGETAPNPKLAAVYRDALRELEGLTGRLFLG